MRSLLLDQATSPLGREVAARLVPRADFAEVESLQAETSEAVELLTSRGSVSMDGVVDLRPHIRKAEIGVTLEPSELWEVVCTLRSARRLRKFIAGAPRPTPGLAEAAGRIADLGELESRILRSVGEDGFVLESASPRLRELRSRMNSARNRIHEALEKTIRSPLSQRFLQEPIVTLRNGRYVLPVKQEHQGLVPGIVHDHSGSGATVFLEPLPVVGLNNALKQLESEERAEVERILEDLTQEVSVAGTALAACVEAVAAIDFAFAKARLSLKLAATRPILNDRGWINIRGGRHPLLSDPVPIDVWLGEDFTGIVITGPNTGGKTMTLKTVGLLTLMAQAGLHPPAEKDTELAVFTHVFADIGDEQSTEQSLSTFSSHMSNIVSFLQEAGDNQLVLLDELGAGTDPQEGAALAMALLEEFSARGARLVATTHYSELKVFAAAAKSIGNASAQFDSETLRPTYKLVMGVPGTSNAFLIAQRLGLPEGVLERASRHLGEKPVQIEEMVRSLEENRQVAEASRSEATRLMAEARKRRDQYDKLLVDLRSARMTLLEDAKLEARRLVRLAKDEARAILGELRGREAAGTLTGSLVREASARLDQVLTASQGASVEESFQPPDLFGEIPGAAAEGEGTVRTVIDGSVSAYTPWPFEARAGDTVLVLPLRSTGVLLELDLANDQATVRVGPMKVAVRLLDLGRPLEQPEPSPAERKPAGSESHGAAHSISASKMMDVSREIHLRGLTVEEALARTDKYLDDVFLAGLSSVRIIHGKGTGVLRNAIRDYLSSHPRVGSFRSGDASEGGAGVTVVEVG